LPIKQLPHRLVHGDIIKTNVMKDKTGKIYIIDFSVANFYPRIQELAVLLCNIFFDENHPDTFMDNYKLALDEYQKGIPLTPLEISSLPLYVKVAHAMHVLCATYEKEAKGNDSAENRYWLELGRKGLDFTIQLWKK
jgi:Ser/Thr protein kinase RdoA (MazF antagonist)